MFEELIAKFNEAIETRHMVEIVFRGGDGTRMELRLRPLRISGSDLVARHFEGDFLIPVSEVMELEIQPEQFGLPVKPISLDDAKGNFIQFDDFFEY